MAISSSSIAPEALELGEDPGTAIPERSRSAPRSLGQHAGEVGRDPPAGHVRGGVDRTGVRGEHARHVRGVQHARREQHVVDGAVATPPTRGRRASRPCELEQHVARERVAVGAQPPRREGDERVAARHAVGTELLVALDDADGEAREVELVRRHDAGVLGGLAAEQRAADLEARRVDRPRRARRRARGRATPDGEVVEEEEGLGAGADEVVDAHRDEVVPDRRADARLRARPRAWCPTPSVVATRTGSRHPPSRSENRPANPPIPPRTPGRSAERRRRGDPRDRRVARGDVDSGGGVGRGRATRHAPTPVAPRTSRGTRVGYRPVRHASQNPRRARRSPRRGAPSVM